LSFKAGQTSQEGKMPRSAEIEISASRMLRVGVIVLALTGLGLLTKAYWQPALTGGSDSEPEGSDSTAPITEDVARYRWAIDYLDPDGWLERFRPLATDDAIEALEQGFIPKLWPVYEEAELVIELEQISASDQGIVAADGLWEVHLVEVTFDDPPEAFADELDGNSLLNYILMLQTDEGLKLQAFISEAEYEFIYSQYAVDSQE
jgi:hypothetical protein